MIKCGASEADKVRQDNCLNDLNFLSFLQLSGANILLIFGENRLKYMVSSKMVEKFSYFVEIDYFLVFLPKKSIPGAAKIVEILIVKFPCFRPVSRSFLYIGSDKKRNLPKHETRKFPSSHYFWHRQSILFSTK